MRSIYTIGIVASLTAAGLFGVSKKSNTDIDTASIEQDSLGIEMRNKLDSIKSLNSMQVEDVVDKVVKYDSIIVVKESQVDSLNIVNKNVKSENKLLKKEVQDLNNREPEVIRDTVYLETTIKERKSFWGGVKRDTIK